MAKSIVSTAVLLAALVLATGLQAQGGPTTLQFSFSNPGARSLGLGGAFAALADDATAAFANPAGLTQLTRPEVSLEGRYWSYTTPYTEGGRVSGEATGIGLDGPIRIADSEFDTSALSFLSFVYPGRNWTVALSRHQSARFEASSATQGLFTDDLDDDPQPTCLPGTNVCRYPDATSKTDISIVSTTASFAYRLTDAFSLGLGLSYFQGDLSLVQSLYLPTVETLPEGFFGPNVYLGSARFGDTEIDFDDTDWGVNFGFLWFPSQQISLGGFVRQGARFTGSVVQIIGPAFDPSILDDAIGASESGIPLDVPNVYGLGLAYRSKNGSWTASFEWDRVLYSSILESLNESSIIETELIRLDDVSELRFGFEYAFLRRTPLLALRGGVWRNPDHTIRSIETVDPLELALLPGGEDDVHFALGFGVAFKDLQVDFAVDFSDLVDTASLSLIYRF
jgi:long-subunit fatty acid transport protein